MRIKPDKYLNNLTCLYVEDDKEIRDSFLPMIERYFKEVIVATNGKEGLEKFKTDAIDIILSDIRMPYIDGIEMAKKIREIDSKVFIIFLTAFDASDYLKEAIEIGVEGYLTKPLDRNKLLRKLNFLATVIKNERDSIEYQELLQAMLNAQVNAVCIIDKKDQIKLSNKSFKNIFGNIYNLDELKKLIDINISLSHQNKNLTLANQTKEFSIFIKKYNNEYKIISFEDVTEFNKIYIDELTQLYNRKIVVKKLSNLQQKEIYLIMFDIDNFKIINDTYGHNIGDIVLKKISSTILKNTRKDDIAIRWGGEEFLIVLKDIIGFDIPKKIAENLRKSIENISFKEFDRTITCSFGICSGIVEHEESFMSIVKKSDNALYQAKKEGKNRVKICQK